MLWLLAIGASAIYPPWRFSDSVRGQPGSPASGHLVFEYRQVWQAYAPQEPNSGGYWNTVNDVIDWPRLSLEWVAITAVAAAVLLGTDAFGKREAAS